MDVIIKPVHRTLASPDNPAEWPAEARQLFERAVTSEYATLNPAGVPLTYPVIPFLGEDGSTLDVSTGLTYPGKAERARSNPKVALLFSDPVGTGLQDPPVVLVQGLAAVRDADLQANTDRYMRESFRKLPEAYAGMPAFLLQRMPWYYARIWVLVTPLRMLIWPEGDLSRQPERWEAPTDTPIPTSDPAPPGQTPGAWTQGPADWRPGAVYALRHLGDPVLTVVGEDGFPLPVRVRCITMVKDGFQFIPPEGFPGVPSGKACLTFHTHPERFTAQHNLVFSGHIDPQGNFTTHRQLGDWSLNGTRLQALATFLRNGRILTPRLQAEARRRGQKVPVVRLPK